MNQRAPGMSLEQVTGSQEQFPVTTGRTQPFPRASCFARCILLAKQGSQDLGPEPLFFSRLKSVPLSPMESHSAVGSSACLGSIQRNCPVYRTEST